MWGVRSTPACVPQNDRHDALIMLREISQGELFSLGPLCGPIPEPGLVLRLPLYKGSVTGALFPPANLFPTSPPMHCLHEC